MKSINSKHGAAAHVVSEARMRSKKLRNQKKENLEELKKFSTTK
jgi:hypothetical protein